jgi:hypothetical protein
MLQFTLTYQSNYGNEEFNAAKRILRYLKGTKDYVLTYGPFDKIKFPILTAYVDADFANYKDRKSLTGYTFKLSGQTISWKTKKQPTVSLSTVEAEYIALATASSELIWIRNFLNEIGFKQPTTTIYEDNQGCIAIANNPIVKSRVKHVDIKYHFLRERILNNELLVKYISTSNQEADLFTKGLPKETFQRIRSLVSFQIDS